MLNEKFNEMIEKVKAVVSKADAEQAVNSEIFNDLQKEGIQIKQNINKILEVKPDISI